MALPTEHGGWGFTLEPVLLGLAVAPNLAGAGLAAGALAVFLARRPLRLLAEDRRSRRWLARTSTAVRVLAAAGVVAAGGLALAALQGDPRFWWAAAAALPAVVTQVGADFARRNRAFVAEAAGAVAMGAAAPAIALAGGWAAAPAFALWAVIAGRALPSILYVRAQIRRSKGQAAHPAATHAAHAVFVTLLALLGAGGVAPWTASGAVAGLWAWAAFGLGRPPVPTRTLGWTQVAAGILVVGVTAAGHHLGW